MKCHNLHSMRTHALEPLSTKRGQYVHYVVYVPVKYVQQKTKYDHDDDHVKNLSPSQSSTDQM